MTTYIDRDGNVRQGPQPWGISKLISIFWGFIDLFVMFFRTLVPGLEDSSGSSSGYGRGPRPPRPGGGRNVRGFGSVSDIAPPPCGAGS